MKTQGFQTVNPGTRKSNFSSWFSCFFAFRNSRRESVCIPTVFYRHFVNFHEKELHFAMKTHGFQTVNSGTRKSNFSNWFSTFGEQGKTGPEKVDNMK